MSSNRFEAGDGLSFDGRSHGNRKVSSVGSESECLSQGIIPSPILLPCIVGGAVASCLVRSSRLRIKRSGFELWPGSLCCVLGKDTTLTAVPLSTQVYKWVPANVILEVTL